MEFTLLGRTKLKVSVAGLGCGGPSRLGLRQSGGEKVAIALIRQAIDNGINLLDTAESYGTESVVGKAIAGVSRESVVLSTKKTLPSQDQRNLESEVKKSLEQSLAHLKTDFIDIYQIHGVERQDYAFARDRLLPPLLKLREQGKIRFIGITEGFVPDPSHRMLQEALKEDHWDVVMVGFNFLNPSARTTVFSLTREKNVGVLNMFAVRRALSQPKRFLDVVTELKNKGLLGGGSQSAEELLDFLMTEGNSATLPEVAYRFCRHEPGVHVVLFGTGNPEHLKSNLETLVKPPLPQVVRERLEQMFGRVDSVTGN